MEQINFSYINFFNENNRTLHQNKHTTQLKTCELLTDILCNCKLTTKYIVQ